MGNISQRKGMINDTLMRDGTTTIMCNVPLANMFGYMTGLRSMTQAKGEFSMEYARHEQMNKGDIETLVAARAKERGKEKLAATTRYKYKKDII